MQKLPQTVQERLLTLPSQVIFEKNICEILDNLSKEYHTDSTDNEDRQNTHYRKECVYANI